MTTTSSFSLATVRSEFIANSFPLGNQTLPSVQHLSNGGFVVAYNSQIGGDGSILLDFYDSNSNRINATPRATYDSLATTSASGQPTLTQLADGNVLVVWSNLDPANLGLRAAKFSPDGEKIGSEIIIGHGQASTPHITALSDGGFALADVYQGHIYASAHDANGLSSAAFAHLDLAGGTVSDPTCTALSNGNFVVAWSCYPGPGSTIQLHARVCGPDGTPITGDMLLDGVGHNGDPSIAALGNGSWVVAYGDTSWANESGSSGITLNILTSHGSSALPGGPIHVNNPSPQVDGDPSVSVLDNGMILVTWHREVSPSSYDVYGRIFTHTGEPVTIAGIFNEFLISSAAGNDTYPDVTALDSGRFVTAWTSSTGNLGQDIAAVVKELIRSTTGNGADDTYAGDALRDVISSGGGNDTVSGGAGDDVVNAGAGNDTIIEGQGADVIDGGAGNDTVVFTQTFDRYLMSEFGDTIYISGPDGQDHVANVEHFQFADATFHVTDDGNPLFDTAYYMSHNHDVFYSGVNALQHFNTFGWHEGRDPNPLFDTSGYLGANKDVAASGQNPLEHYHQTGWHQGRDPSAYFDTTLYLVNNPDVAAAGVDPLEHYLTHGAAEGRNAYGAIGQNIVSGFDAEYYLLHNPDVAAAGVDPLQHYNTSGWHEGRNPNAWFDTSGYLSHYSDVAASGANPLQHYMQSGWHEGRDPSAGFDTLGYLAQNSDVAAAGANPLQHFLSSGIYEGRSAMGDGLWHV